MNGSLIIHGKVSGQVFVPDEPMPDIEGPAELIVYAEDEAHSGTLGRRSVYDFIGKSSEPRSAEDLDAQLREDRDSWSDP